MILLPLLISATISTGVGLSTAFANLNNLSTSTNDAYNEVDISVQSANGFNGGSYIFGGDIKSYSYNDVNVSTQVYQQSVEAYTLFSYSCVWTYDSSGISITLDIDQNSDEYISNVYLRCQASIYKYGGGNFNYSTTVSLGTYTLLRPISQTTTNSTTYQSNYTFGAYIVLRFSIAPLNYDLTQDYNNYSIGYNQGYYNGYSSGQQDGYTSGYSTGFNEALDTFNESNEVFVSSVASILEIGLLPVNIFMTLLDIEVFGINIGAFVSSLITIVVITILLRTLLGGKGGKDE